MNKNVIMAIGCGTSPTHEIGKLHASRSPGPSVYKSFSAAKHLYFQVSEKAPAGSTSKRSSRVSACWPVAADECPYQAKQMSSPKLAVGQHVVSKRLLKAKN